jgi:hypothetical protein
MLFYLLPLLLGRGMVVGINKIKKFPDKGEKLSTLILSKILRIPAYYSLGLLIIFGWAMGIRYGLSELVGVGFEKLFFKGIWVMLGLGGVVNLMRLPDHLGKIFKRLIPVFAGIFTLSVISYSLWLWKSPSPLNWDWYQHQTLARNIQDGEISYFTSEMSDTFGFDSYPPMFHLVVSLAQYPMNLSPDMVMDFWQLTSFWHVMSMGLVSYLFGYVVTKDKTVSWLMVLFGVMVFDSTVSLTTFFLLPQTLAAVLFVGLFSRLLNEYGKEGVLPWWEVVAGGVALGLMHYLVGIIGGIIYVSLSLFMRLKRKWKNIDQFPWGYLVVVLSIVGILLVRNMDLGHLNGGEAELFNFSLEKKIGALERSYGLLAYVLGSLGLIAIMNEKNKKIGLVSLVGFGLMALLLSSTPYVLKIYTIARFFVHILMVFGLWGIMKKQRYVLTKYISVLLVGGGLVWVLVANIYNWKSGLLYKGEYTHIGKDDVEASDQLFDRYEDEKVLLISDPGTQFILEGLSGVDSVGGAYMNKEIRDDLYLALEDESGGKLLELVRGVGDEIGGEYDHRLLALSGRTFMWESSDQDSRYSYAFNVWSPVDLRVNDFERIVSLVRQEEIRVFYQSPSLVILEVK